MLGALTLAAQNRRFWLKSGSSSTEAPVLCSAGCDVPRKPPQVECCCSRLVPSVTPQRTPPSSTPLAVLLQPAPLPAGAAPGGGTHRRVCLNPAQRLWGEGTGLGSAQSPSGSSQRVGEQSWWQQACACPRGARSELPFAARAEKLPPACKAPLQSEQSHRGALAARQGEGTVPTFPDVTPWPRTLPALAPAGLTYARLHGEQLLSTAPRGGTDFSPLYLAAGTLLLAPRMRARLCLAWLHAGAGCESQCPGVGFSRGNDVSQR